MTFIERMDPGNQLYPSTFSSGFHQYGFCKIQRTASVFCGEPLRFLLYHVEYFHSFENRSVCKKWLWRPSFHFVRKTRFCLTVPLFLYLQVVSSFSLLHIMLLWRLFYRRLWFFFRDIFFRDLCSTIGLLGQKECRVCQYFSSHFCGTRLYRAKVC